VTAPLLATASQSSLYMLVADDPSRSTPSEWTGSTPDPGAAPDRLTLDTTRDEPLAYSHTSQKRAHWYQTSALLVGEVMGTGVLSLPYAAAGLGWVLSAAALIVFAFASTYAGVLLARVKNDFYPRGDSYADMAYAISGTRFGLYTRCAIITGWAMLLPYFLIATADSLKIVFLADAEALCTWHWTLVVAALLLPLLQLTTLTSISYLAWPSSAAILVAIVLVIVGFGSSGGGAQARGTTSVGLPAGSGFLETYGHLASFVFAYQGQSMFLEMQAEMRDARMFPKACRVAYGLISVVYSLTTGVAYGMQGSTVASFLPDSLGDGLLKRLVGVCLGFHILVAYVVTAQPLTAYIYSKAFPYTPKDAPTLAVRVRWLLVSSAYLTFAVLVANAIPFFSDLQELIGAMTGAPIIFGWPAFFYLSACRQRGRAVASVDLVLCGLSLFVCLPVFTLLGTASAIQTIADDVGHLGGPFQCGRA